jgi:hypothetical protein
MTVGEALHAVLIGLILVVGFSVCAGIVAVVVRLIVMFFKGDLDG